MPGFNSGGGFGSGLKKMSSLITGALDHAGRQDRTNRRYKAEVYLTGMSFQDKQDETVLKSTSQGAMEAS